ncbi:RHS repeat domain-containing protein [Emticicia sp. 21SJ11W-3]|uniref:RHS repeat domain-containing protein n=1 Tax=Emticicia sp. 21SJ11W-3 TaxID=2916755 RepID=UPI0020A19DD7|nr:RHS repeat-associated core domain-containing protein [Emticicia sp. 21SJ11W-3]UTA66872.1 cell wall-associated protein [Emticicia sp. 21SJ11W-3]
MGGLFLLFSSFKRTTAGYYDGNIGKQYWQASNNNAPSGLRTYTFSYDNISRLKSATYSGLGSESYGLAAINYDRNGNITSMQRNGKLSSTTYGLMDNLTYTYAGNRLTKVEDAVTGNYEVDFVNRNSGTDDYTYYANGALKADKNEDITDIIYSTYANQPIEIQLTGGRWIKNFYDGAGRLYKTSYSTGEYWEYLDGMVFKNGAFYQLATPEGRANYQSGAWSYEYFITDHLGNTRVAYKANGTALTKTSETAFDPWGVVLKDAGLVNTFQNKFEYQNKEKESTFNLRRISIGARTYNPSIGRFDGVDVLADKIRRYSPYNYSFNSPLRFIDPDGRYPYPINIRAFAPFKEFGGRFAGDNRSFSTSQNVTSRLAQSFTMNTDNHTYSGLQTSSSPSSHPILGTATATDDKGSISNFVYSNNKDGSTTTSWTSKMSGHNPLIPGSSDIDVTTNFTLSENKQAGTLGVNVTQTGDAFPSAETMIGDTKGNQLMIGVSPAVGNPYTSLPGDNNRPMMSANFTVTMDKKGVFTGVVVGSGKNATTYSISDWNKMMQSTPAVKN